MSISNMIKRLFSRKAKVLVTDLDGTLIETKSGNTFPVDCDDWKFKEGVLDAILKYAPSHVLIASNQGGIELGYVDENLFNDKMNYICEIVQRETNAIVYYDYCPIASEDERRKPNTGMLVDMSRFIKITNKDRYLMIGDASGKEGQFSDSDFMTSQNFGISYMDVDDFISAMK